MIVFDLWFALCRSGRGIYDAVRCLNVSGHRR